MSFSKNFKRVFVYIRLQKAIQKFNNVPNDNFCRYEGGTAKPWCYTMDPSVRKEECNSCGSSDEFDPWAPSVDSITGKFSAESAQSNCFLVIFLVISYDS